MTTNRTNQPAVDFDLPDTEGARHRLADYTGHWLLLVFHRHLECLICRDHIEQLRRRAAELEQADIRAAVVTFEVSCVARNYVRKTGLPWPLLDDEQRVLYRAYGMGRGSYWRILGPKSWWAYMKIMLRGRLPKMPKDDPYQLGGDVLIDPRGIVRLQHVSTMPADRPSVDAILACARGAS